MAEETQIQEAGNVPMKRNLGRKKGSKGKKRLKVFKGSGEKVKIDKKMKKLCHKKARDYNSDDDEEPTTEIRHKKEHPKVQGEAIDETSSDGEGEDLEDVEVSEDEDGEIQAGVTKFAEGCKAFKLAFKRITKKSASDNVLGPVLSAHKKLIAEKLAEEEVDRKVKGEAKKEKHMVGEKGHVKPANFLDAHEKFLIGVATKGVVKLFNAVNKAQNAQKGLNPARSKDAKVIKKRRKEAFFSELSKMPSQSADPSAKRDGEGPAWAPLRDNYMLTNSKLKDWDKTPDTHAADDFGMQADSSSNDED